MNILNRNSTTINIATFWENHQLKKYNYSPAYQREGEVWDDVKKSFLIDTILKNFPIPPIFLHQHIDANGKTLYDVIDGKQRLEAILDFIKDKIPTPDDFSSDGFGDINLNGIFFKDLDGENLSEWKKNFWRYELTVEYVDTDQVNVVNNIFDRLNRNGVPLNRQELRNAKYHSSNLYTLVKTLTQHDSFKPIFGKIQQARKEDDEFISELLFTIIEKNVITGDSPNYLDELYEKYASIENTEEIKVIFNSVTEVFSNFNLDYNGYKINGPSHIYGLWSLAYILYSRQTNDNEISVKLNDFYKALRNKSDNADCIAYKNSMSAGTKSRSRRVMRVNALLNYCGYNTIE